MHASGFSASLGPATAEVDGETSVNGYAECDLPDATLLERETAAQAQHFPGVVHAGRDAVRPGRYQRAPTPTFGTGQLQLGAVPGSPSDAGARDPGKKARS